MGLFLTALLVVLVGGMTACTGHHPDSSSNVVAGSRVLAGTYTVTVTATAQGVAQATTTFQLTVQ